MKYIFIDTNNWKFCSLLMREDHTPQTLKKLESILSQQNNIKLLMPEVIKLEYFRVVDNAFVEDVKKEMQGLKHKVQDVLPEHLKNQKIKFYEVADNLAEEREKAKNSAIKVFENIVELDNTIEISLTSEIIVEAEKRRIKNLAPSNGTHSDDQDCYIIESLKTYFNDDVNKNNTLIFCTEDDGFVDEEDDGLHKDIKDDFKLNLKHFQYLHDMLKEEFEININEEEAENIEKMKKQKKLVDVSNKSYFTDKEKYLYQNFADILVSHIISINSDSIDLVENPKEIINSLGEVIEKSRLEEYLQDNSLLISCFINSKYKVSSKTNIKVSTIEEFYNFLKNISPQKREFVINSLHSRFKNIKSDFDIPF